MEAFEQRCIGLFERLGIAEGKDVLAVRGLLGGVASDIGVVSLADRDICVKFALPKLRVTADWRAPVHRNKAEYAWLRFASTVVPESVPRLLGWSAEDHGFAMEFIGGDKVFQWKERLMKVGPTDGEAQSVARVLGAIHNASSGSDFDRGSFANRDDFRALRLEPYLSYTAEQHPRIARQMNEMAEALYGSELALVHGDVSPKNILFRGDDPIILDSECATLGDPIFDAAFCLNHLFLKAAHRPEKRRHFLSAVLAFWRTYASAITWEAQMTAERRTSRLLPMLMLARVDGKSPVEYLSERSRSLMRDFAVEFIAKPAGTIETLVTTFENKSQRHA